MEMAFESVVRTTCTMGRKCRRDSPLQSCLQLTGLLIISAWMTFVRGLQGHASDTYWLLICSVSSSSKITWHFCPGNKMWIKHLFCVRCQYTSAGCSPFLDHILLCPRGPCGCGNRLLELICSSDYKFQTNRIPCLVASYMATIIFEILV